jgi:hypothetical protein
VTKNIPCINQPFVANDTNNILLNGKKANPPTHPPNTPPFFPTRNTGSVPLLKKRKITFPVVSSNWWIPTPRYRPESWPITFKTKRNLDSFVNVMMLNYFPVLLDLKNSGYFQELLYPNTYEILKDGVTEFTSMTQIRVSACAT